MSNGSLWPAHKIVEQLATAGGRSKLQTYAMTTTGHAHLTQTHATTTNTFVRALLSSILVSAAEAAVEQDSLVLTHANAVEGADLVATVIPRGKPSVFVESEFVEQVNKILTRYRVDAYDRDDVRSRLIGSKRLMMPRMLAAGEASLLQDFFSVWDVFRYLKDGINDNRLNAKQTRCSQEIMTLLLSTTDAQLPFAAQVFAHFNSGWEDFLAHGSASAGVLALAGREVTDEAAWQVVSERAKHDFRDALVTAASHPSIVEREQALTTVEAQIPYLMDKTLFYNLAEVMGYYPDRVWRHLLPSVRATLADAWTSQEQKTWEAYLFQWSGTRPHLDPKPKRWWEAR